MKRQMKCHLCGSNVTEYQRDYVPELHEMYIVGKHCKHHRKTWRNTERKRQLRALGHN